MLRLRSGNSTATVRMDAMNSENMMAYFDFLSDVYDEFDFGNNPRVHLQHGRDGSPFGASLIHQILIYSPFKQICQSKLESLSLSLDCKLSTLEDSSSWCGQGNICNTTSCFSREIGL